MIRLLAVIILTFCLFFSYSYAAPCYGTKMPQRGKFFARAQTHIIFKRYLEQNYGTLKSTQHFFGISWGPYDWLSIDLKAGAGNIKQHPIGSDEIDYSSSFAGGYGLRLRLYHKEKIKAVFGFQHISIHPKSVRLNGVKNRAVLDDWQVSLLGSYDFSKITPYAGLKWSRVDYIHWVGGKRERRMSDLDKTLGLVFGFDLSLTPKTWLNVEGKFLNSEALTFGFNWAF